LEFNINNWGCFGGKNINNVQIKANHKNIVSNCKIDDEIGCIEIKIHRFPRFFNENKLFLLAILIILVRE